MTRGLSLTMPIAAMVMGHRHAHDNYCCGAVASAVSAAIIRVALVLIAVPVSVTLIAVLVRSGTPDHSSGRVRNKGFAMLPWHHYGAVGRVAVLLSVRCD